MTTRREFLQAGIGVSTLPILSGVSVSSKMKEVEEPALTPLHKVIFDERFPDSVAFGSEAEKLGMPVHGIRGDMTDFWVHDLYYCWQNAPSAIAGLTAHGPLFCLEHLAWDHGMRVVFRAEHTYLPNNRIEHVLSGPESLLRQAASLNDCGSNWGSRVALMVARCPENRVRAATVTIAASARAQATDEQGSLFSWIIAPLARA